LANTTEGLGPADDAELAGARTKLHELESSTFNATHIEDIAEQVRIGRFCRPKLVLFQIPGLYSSGKNSWLGKKINEHSGQFLVELIGKTSYSRPQIRLHPLMLRLTDLAQPVILKGRQNDQKEQKPGSSLP
jgi:hypothetical protein